MTVELPGWVPGEDVIAAERAVLGAAISSQQGAEAAASVLQAADFFRPAHQIIFGAITNLADYGKPVSPATVLAELTTLGELSRAGGANELHSLMAVGEAWAMPANIERISGDAARRHVIEVAARVTQLASEPGFDPAAGVELARRMLDQAFGARTGSEPATSEDLFDEAVGRLEHPEDVAGMIVPPWADLRDLIPVLRPGQLITVGARPGVGKSMIAADLTRHVGLRMREPVILFSLEMTRAEVTDRLISAETSVPLSRIQAAALDDRDWDRVAKARAVFADGAFVIDDEPGITLAHIRSRLRGMARRRPARLAIVDYLQLMKTPGGSESREREIAALAAGLKLIAREFAIPLVLLAQLNRGPEARSDHRPTKSDLRESGAIENDSDVVILIHRPDLHDPDSGRPGEADLIVDKNRAGPTGTRPVVFQGHYGRFGDLARHWSPSDVISGAA